MKPSRVLCVAATAAFTVFCAAAIAGCSSSGSSGNAVAATVNGTEIKEQTITDYVQNFRDSQGLTDESSWGAWMANYSTDPAGVRSDVIDYFVEREVVKQAAEQNNVSVSDDEVNEQIDAMKANYGGDDEAWKKALESAKLTEDQYRENLTNAMLEKKLQDAVVTDTDLSDDDVLNSVKMYAAGFNGAKRSSHILFNSGDEETAQKVLDQINNGEVSFDEAAKQYSIDTASAQNGGDVGWDLLNNFVADYTQALSGLEKDQVSDLITSDFGIHIIKCTDVFSTPDEITSLDQVPEALVDYIKQMMASDKVSSSYSEWLDNFKGEQKIVVNDMPKGLPYDVDMSSYQKSEESSDAVTSETGAIGTDDAAQSGDQTDDSAESETATEETAS